MLSSLLIKNYALIDSLEVGFGPGLNIITGETGAGKSIIIGALSLILGQRADSTVLRNDDRKCIVEGVFKIDLAVLGLFFRKHNLDSDPSTIIRREIYPSGKSRAFINDTPIKLSLLRELAGQLVDLHKQHETTDLKQNRFQLKVVDILAGNEMDIDAYKKEYSSYKSLIEVTAKLREEKIRSDERQDYINFQFQELQNAQLKDQDELEKTEEELNRLTHAESIKDSLNQSILSLYESDSSISGQLSQVIRNLKSISSFHNDIQALSERMESLHIELSDIMREMESIESQIVHNPEKINLLNDRVNEINRLIMKHNVQTIPELINLQENFEQQLLSSSSLNTQIEETERKILESENILNELANKISIKRKTAARAFSLKIAQLLPEAGMPDASLEVRIENIGGTKPGLNGKDLVSFYFTANKGSGHQQLDKVASGGELSRLLLVIKSMIAGSSLLSTLIFDEIDSGISGETGSKIAGLMKGIAKDHQVLCITHLPQIAGRGEHHFKVFKHTDNGITNTYISKLDPNGRRDEIAKMLSGGHPSEAALENARELLSN